MPESGVLIRKATSDDIASIVELNFALFQEDAGQHDPYMNLNWPREEGHEHFSKLLSDDESLCLLATTGEAVIGYLVGYLWHGGTLRPVKIAELESMYVLPNWRSRGVGRQLADEFLKWAKQKGAQRASVTAYAANTRAIEFYQELGFEPKSLALEMGFKIDVDIRPWSDGDLLLLERLMGDPAMTEHIGGPETPEKIRERHQRYLSSDLSNGSMFAIVVGPERVVAGSIGYWEREWQGQKVWETGWSVLPEFQGQGVASRATMAVVEKARLEGKYQFMHAFPSVDNIPSNAICRKVGFSLQGEVDFEYPPGKFMRCNDWRLDLFTDFLEALSA